MLSVCCAVCVCTGPSFAARFAHRIMKCSLQNYFISTSYILKLYACITYEHSSYFEHLDTEDQMIGIALLTMRYPCEAGRTGHQKKQIIIVRTNGFLCTAQPQTC